MTLIHTMHTMHNTRHLLVLVLVSAAAGAGCAQRTNPMVTSITTTRGVEEVEELSTVAFTYDDAFHPTQVAAVTFDREGDLEETWDLTFNRSDLVEFTRAVKRGGAEEAFERTTVSYLGANIEAMVTDAGDRAERTTAFGYDAGQLVKMTIEETSPNGNFELQRDFRYDESGQLVRITSKPTVNDEARDETDLSIAYAEGRPVTITTVEPAGEAEQTTTVSVAYEEGRFTTFTSVFTPADPEAEEQTTETLFSYDDDGLIVGVVIPVPDEEGEEEPEEDDIRIALTYEEAEVDDLDVTPLRLLGLPLFDLRGFAGKEIVEGEQTARLSLELGW